MLISGILAGGLAKWIPDGILEEKSNQTSLEGNTISAYGTISSAHYNFVDVAQNDPTTYVPTTIPSAAAMTEWQTCT